MSSASAVCSAALHLARQERADLARQLIASLDEDVDTSDEGVEAGWLVEVEQRLVAAEQGSGSFVSWEAAEERIAARLRDMRR